MFNLYNFLESLHLLDKNGGTFFFPIFHISLFIPNFVTQKS